MTSTPLAALVLRLSVVVVVVVVVEGVAARVQVEPWVAVWLMKLWNEFVPERHLRRAISTSNSWFRICKPQTKHQRRLQPPVSSILQRRQGPVANPYGGGMGAITTPLSWPVFKNNENVQNCDKYAPNLTFFCMQFAIFLGSGPQAP